MTTQSPPGKPAQGRTARQAAKAARVAREAAALRANLRKRKDQARAQAQPCADGGLPPEPNQTDR